MACLHHLQEGQAAVQNGGQLPQHQQHLHGHAAPQGAAAATGPNNTTAGANGSSQSAGAGQQTAGSGTGASSSGSAGSNGQNGGTSGQGDDGNDPGRGNQGGHAGHAAGSSSGRGTQQQQGQQGDPNQPQPGSAPASGAWAAANYGYVWNMPQWVPATSMALFAPAMGYHPMQYAGQTNPASVAPELQVAHCIHCAPTSQRKNTVLLAP